MSAEDTNDESALSSVKTFLSFFDSHKKQLLEDYFTFLRFKSISTESAYKQEVRRCMTWLEAYIGQLGFTTEIWEGPEHPVLFAHWLHAGPDKPTVLIYNHYDVQPVDPLELWESPPFEPEIRGGEVYARGAEDNKGQCFYVLSALQALFNRDGKLPLNVKLCIEGEEEAGSVTINSLLPSKKEPLRADYLLVVDLGFPAADIPAVTLGCRGIVSVSLELRGSKTDLHSGEHGGVAYNPNHALIEMLAKLHDCAGRVLLPGFYDDVLEASAEDKNVLYLDFNAAKYEAAFGAKPVGGERNYAPLESAWLRPTLEINGIGGGYTGEGFKTVIPARAIAKLSCRLVPNQDPEKIAASLQKFLNENCPPGIELMIKTNPGSRAFRTRPDSKVVQAAAQAFSEVCGVASKYILCGGSIPVTGALGKTAGAETVLLGYGLADDNIHAPNEHFGVDRLRKGLATMAVLLEKLAKR